MFKGEDNKLENCENFMKFLESFWEKNGNFIGDWSAARKVFLKIKRKFFFMAPFEVNSSSL